ncbi:hypothetical protein RvY_00042 [Ramazzottius varieornatus]|uniref:Uncharacterized protein n=1 Tax=Ramazzottius varieornatus TaxID=947166 RepID=A0A1D1UB93_RAMVA|nr:hypothetical protein RvY_00042 [Ramazzottius varieornatus]
MDGLDGLLVVLAEEIVESSSKLLSLLFHRADLLAECLDGGVEVVYHAPLDGQADVTLIGLAHTPLHVPPALPVHSTVLPSNGQKLGDITEVEELLRLLQHERTQIGK